MTQQQMTKERMYQVIYSPYITEKSTLASQYNQFSFKVALDANKTDVHHAIEGIFNVKVKSVNTLILKGKRKVFRGRRGRRSDFKKAIVTLQDGYSIDFETGV